MPDHARAARGACQTMQDAPSTLFIPDSFHLQARAPRVSCSASFPAKAVWPAHQLSKLRGSLPTTSSALTTLELQSAVNCSNTHADRSHTAPDTRTEWSHTAPDTHTHWSHTAPDTHTHGSHTAPDAHTQRTHAPPAWDGAFASLKAKTSCRRHSAHGSACAAGWVSMRARRPEGDHV